MKCLMVCLASLGLILSCNGQDIPSSKVPSVVLNALASKYPAATDVEWEKHDNLYEAEFNANNSTEIAVRIDVAGKLLMQKRDVSVRELTPAVTAAIQRLYKDYTIDEVERIETDAVDYYQVELNRRGKKDLNLVFAADGKQEKPIAYWD